MSSSSFFRNKYDVFLSFRGEDTRKSFTDHLYEALKRNGIVTFRDELKLEAGEEIGSNLFGAIKESWCSIIVFSKTYAHSSWCLDELAEIVRHKRGKGHKVFPVFYHVDPSDLRKQTGGVGEAFARHEHRCKDKIQSWRDALTEVASIKGWHLNDRHESEFIRDIVKKISAKLCIVSSVPNHRQLIGIDSRLEELHSKINIGEDDVRIIGIWGMGGIGKTTLARAIYAQMSPHFEGKCFLADVREVSEKYGLVSVQKQLLSQILPEEGFNLFNVYDGSDMINHRLSRKQVLVVIDDADNLQQLEYLVGDRNWFGFGSRIIVTTRDKQLLEAYQVDDVYKPTLLDAREGLRLFNSKAFKSDRISYDFVQLSERVVKYADGLPLALKVLGSFLCGRDATKWISAIERLERDSNKEIHDRLQISFDGLDETEQDIFLDVACFFKGEKIDFVTKILDACGFFPEIGIDALIKKSLITVTGNKLGMHDLLQEMGRQIVRQKSIVNLGKRCRLWKENDIYHVLTKNIGTEAVQGMIVPGLWEQSKTFSLSADVFVKMTKLRLLKLLYLEASSRDLVYLSSELRLIDWPGYPFKSLSSSFHPENLVALIIPSSRIEELWEGKKPLNKLKLVDLKNSESLLRVPDLSMATDLEDLELEGCTSLVDVHPSVGALSRIRTLNLRGCKCLRSIPAINGMESLEILILSSCSNLQSFPEIMGEMRCLSKLYLDRSGLKELPSSIEHLTGLKLLDLRDCKSFRSLPTIRMKFLEKLLLSGCSNLQMFPEIEGKMEYLIELNLEGTAIKQLPSSIGNLNRLNLLNLRGCKNLWSLSTDGCEAQPRPSSALALAPLSGLISLRELILSDCNLGEGAIPTSIGCLSSLVNLLLNGNNFITLPTTLSRLSKLSYLKLTNCKRLKSVPALPTPTSAAVDGCDSLEEVADPVIVCDSMDETSIYALNCFKLAENNYALTMLKRHLKVVANARPKFDIVIPGNEIPEWFSHQSDGSSITITLPPDFNRLIGVALCCIFASVPFNDDPRTSPITSFPVQCCISVCGIKSRISSGFCFPASDQITTDHLWIRYISRDRLGSMLEEFPGVSLQTKIRPGTESEFFYKTDFSFKVKMCGIRMVYLEDVDDQPNISPTNLDEMINMLMALMDHQT